MPEQLHKIREEVDKLRFEIHELCETAKKLKKEEGSGNKLQKVLEKGQQKLEKLKVKEKEEREFQN